MQIYNIKEKLEYLDEILNLTQKEWGQKSLTKQELTQKIINKNNYAKYIETLSNGEKLYYIEL